VLIDQQNARRADILVHGRAVLDGRLVHRTANGRRFLALKKMVSGRDEARDGSRGSPSPALYDRERRISQGFPVKALLRRACKIAVVQVQNGVENMIDAQIFDGGELAARLIRGGGPRLRAPGA